MGGGGWGGRGGDARPRARAAKKTAAARFSSPACPRHGRDLNPAPRRAGGRGRGGGGRGRRLPARVGSFFSVSASRRPPPLPLRRKRTSPPPRSAPSCWASSCSWWWGLVRGKGEREGGEKQKQGVVLKATSEPTPSLSPPSLSAPQPCCRSSAPPPAAARSEGGERGTMASY